MSATLPVLTPEQKRKRAAFIARCVYAAVFVTFFSICTIAVVVSMAMERDKKGFKAIQVRTPISFFDKTYLKDPTPAPAR